MTSFVSVQLNGEEFRSENERSIVFKYAITEPIKRLVFLTEFFGLYSVDALALGSFMVLLSVRVLSLRSKKGLRVLCNGSKGASIGLE